jgi:hypothetical protein
VFHIERGDLFDILEHPNPDRDAGQRIFVVRRGDYVVYLVPFVRRNGGQFDAFAAKFSNRCVSVANCRTRRKDA